MKFVAALLILSLSGCAFLSGDTKIEVPTISPWSVYSDYNGYYRLDHHCSEGGSLSVGMNRLLKREGKLYFIFFILPTGSADLYDMPYTGIKLTTKFSSPNLACNSDDILLITDGKSYSPDSATKADYNELICEYTLSPKIQESGKFSVSFEGMKQCNVPPIEFVYETSNSYNHLMLQR